MSKLTDQLSQNLINHRDYPLVKSVEANTWYTGRDLEEMLPRYVISLLSRKLAQVTKS